MDEINPDARAILEGYLKRKQALPENEFVYGRFPGTTTELVEIIKENYPDDVPMLVGRILSGMTGSDAREYERQQNIEAAAKEFNVDAPVRLDEELNFDLGDDPFGTFKQRKAFPIVSRAKDAARLWASGVGAGILTLSGVPGTGKTHLARACAAFLRQRGESVIFRKETGMFRDIREAMKQGAGEDWIDAYATARHLIIDDLGVEALTQTMQGVQDRLFDARWEGVEYGLRTLVTTNLPGDRLPARIADRLRDKTRSEVVFLVSDKPGFSYREAGK